MSCGDNAILDCSQPPEEDLHPIFREEVEIAVASLKKGKSAGVDNIPGELVQAGGETMVDVLTEICNRIWRTGEWPTPWTQSLLSHSLKRATCSSARTISLISHSSKLMLKIILNRLKPQAEEIIKNQVPHPTCCNRIWRTGEWPTPWTQSLLSHSLKRATCSSARTTDLSASSVIRAKSC